MTSRKATFSVGVASLVFLFGSILQPAVQLLIEGDSVFLSVFLAFREFAPGYLVLGLLLSGLLPGIPTGLAVLYGRSFKQRIAYGAIWAPLSLLAADVLSFYVIWNSSIPMIRSARDWNNIYFSVLSDLTGGVVGGLIIGAALHLYVKATVEPKTASETYGQ